jgi:hypothetical protein
MRNPNACQAIHLARDINVEFQRTLRIPDDGREYPLPPGLGAFPVFAGRSLPRVPRQWRGENVFVIPIHQREAMWLSFHAPWWKPHALKVGIGRVDAISGAPYDSCRLNVQPQDYVVIPDQPWLDGINSGNGTVRQFVAVAIGKNLTVEEQLSNEHAIGGITLTLFSPKPGRFPDEPPTIDWGVDESVACAAAPMGIGAGGRMRQEIYADEHGIDTWQPEPTAHTRIELVDALDFAAITGFAVPDTPVDPELYTRHGLPWFDVYDPVRQDIAPTPVLRGVASIAELTGDAEPTVKIHPGQLVTYVRAPGAATRAG